MLSKVNRAALFMRPTFQARYFAAAAVPEPLSISKLHKMGQDNLALTKIINYESVAVRDVHGIMNEQSSFTSFNDAINRENFGEL
jgi:hypothetical protein